MATSQMSTLIQHLRRAALSQNTAGATDGQLLDSFLTGTDEPAFEELLHRHGPMVLGVCYRILRDHHDAEDAFQATFLIFARKASSVRPRERIANWLHGVAHRTALKSRSMKAKTQVREKQVPNMPEPAAAETDQWDDLQPVLDEELGKLPEVYRLPLLLCDLEGKSIKQATQQLGWPQGTLAGRLARARKKLAKRLTQRGIVLSAGALAAALSAKAASACVTPTLAASTVSAAITIAAGKTGATGMISANVAALMEGVLKGMMLTKIKTTVLVLVVLGMVTFGGGLLEYQRATGQPSLAQREGVDLNNRNADGPIPAADKSNDFRVEVVPGTQVQRYTASSQPAKAGPPKSADVTKLHGAWVGKNTQDGNFIVIFGPKNALRRLNEKGHEYSGTYAVDWTKTPLHLDLKWGDGPTGKTIMEFTQEGKLRIEMGADGEARPKAFTNNVQVIARLAATEPKTAGAAKDLDVADFYRRTGKFASARFYYELVTQRYPDTDFAKKATKAQNDLMKYRIRLPDGSEAWPSPEPQKPQPAPKLAQTPPSGVRTVFLDNAKLVLEPSAKMLLTPVKTPKGFRVRLEVPVDTGGITVEALKIRIEADGKKTEIEATEDGRLQTSNIPAAPRVGEIIVVGNKKTPTGVILKKLAIYPGEPLDFEAVRRAEKNLAAFDATITILDGNSEFRDLLITVKEK